MIRPPHREWATIPGAVSDPPRQDRGDFIFVLGRNEEGDVPADDFLGGVAVDGTGTSVPAGDDAVQVLGKYGVARISAQLRPLSSFRRALSAMMRVPAERRVGLHAEALKRIVHSGGPSLVKRRAHFVPPVAPCSRL